MTTIETISNEGRSFLSRRCQSLYIDGQCYELALALHRGLWWPLVGLLHENTIRHALVRDPTNDQTFLDGRGCVFREDVGRPFGIINPHLVEIKEDDLYAVRPITDMSIATARRMAELLWPHLPWHDSKVSKLEAFAEELEALCQKHRLWIRSAIPAAPPLLAAGEGDEGGYRLQPTDDGITYTIDRYLKVAH